MIIKDLSQYPFLEAFVKKSDQISEEFQNAYNNLEELKEFLDKNKMPTVYNHFGYWVKESGFDVSDIGYDSRGDKPVGGFPIFKKDFPIKWYNVEKTFPVIIKLLTNVPNLHFSQFSIMSPKSHIIPHRHTNVKDSLIFHLNLFNLEGDLAIFNVEDDSFEYNKKGDYFLFNPYQTHESVNNSSSFRITLMMDFR